MDSFKTLISAIGITTGIIFLYRKYKEYTWGWCRSRRRMDGKVVVITGGNSGIGKETAKELVDRGAIVVLACRNRNAAIKAIHQIKSFTKNGDAIFVELDLKSLKSIRKCAENILEKFSHIDVLINNAGVYVPPENLEKTFDGFEIHFGVNHLGHFYLTQLLLHRIKQTKNSRIVAVSSMLYKQGELDFENVKGELGYQKGKIRNPFYNASKLANVLHMKEVAKRLEDTGVGVYVVSPGFVFTSLFRNVELSWLKKILYLPIALLFMRSSKQGAQTTLHCVLSEELDNAPFGFYHDCKKIPLDPVAENEYTAFHLWSFSCVHIDKFWERN